LAATLKCCKIAGEKHLININTFTLGGVEEARRVSATCIYFYFYIGRKAVLISGFGKN